MATIIVVQIVLFSAAMAQQQFGHSNLDGLWFHITSARNPFLSSSQSTCLLWGPPAVKRDDYTYKAEIGAFKLHTRAAIWNEARIICEEEGGHLAIINSIAEAKAITELFQNSEMITGSDHSDLAFIGIHDLFSKGQFITIHGQTLARAGFTQWAPGQPDDYEGKENCGSIYKPGGLNDVNCGTKLGFMCELPMSQGYIPQI